MSPSPSPSGSPSEVASLLPWDDSSLFTPWRDPGSGIVSYVLTARVAPIQQAFYFVTPSLTEDGRFCWFYCAFPPNGNHTLGVVDFERRAVRHFPETQFSGGPLVDEKSGGIYWPSGADLWTRGPGAEDTPRKVNTLPEDWVANRPITSVATHLTFSADRKSLGIDPIVGDRWYVGEIPLDGGRASIWETFDRCYNHGQFSPTDPEVQLLAQDFYTERESGKVRGYENRLWTVRKGTPARPIFPTLEGLSPETAVRMNAHSGRQERVADPRAMFGHEWWGADGRSVWYVHYGRGVERIVLGEKGASPELVWPLRRVSHAHCDARERYLIADHLPADEPHDHRVVFYHRESGREVNVASGLPGLLVGDARKFHVHPHPRFCCRDRVICYTTTVLGRPDIAFVPVEALVRASAAGA